MIFRSLLFPSFTWVRQNDCDICPYFFIYFLTKLDGNVLFLISSVFIHSKTIPIPFSGIHFLLFREFCTGFNFTYNVQIKRGIHSKYLFKENKKFDKCSKIKFINILTELSNVAILIKHRVQAIQAEKIYSIWYAKQNRQFFWKDQRSIQWKETLERIGIWIHRVRLQSWKRAQTLLWEYSCFFEHKCFGESRFIKSIWSDIAGLKYSIVEKQGFKKFDCQRDFKILSELNCSIFGQMGCI